MKTKIFKKFILTALMAAVFTTLAFSQTLTQVVRGTIVDVDSKLPLPGATLVISGTDPLVGTSTQWRLDGAEISSPYHLDDHTALQLIKIPQKNESFVIFKLDMLLIG